MPKEPSIKVSVVVTAYNHERYIAQCLESVLMQKGDFQIEVIVGDDFSTDHTRKIAEEFQRRYTEIIFVLPTEKNLGVIKNLKRCLEACSGEYIAICEGDDYWTYENKLQKQMDFLESRKDCSMCFSAIQLLYEEQGLFTPHHAQSLLEKDAITIEDLIGNNYIGNFSCCMYRTEVIRQLPQEIYDLNTVDWMFNMACAEFGNIGFLQEQMSVYRLHSGGAWTGKDIFEQLEDICTYIDVSNEFFNYKYDALFSQRKQAIKDEMDRRRASENEKKHEGKGFTGAFRTIGLRAMNIVIPPLRLFKNKIVSLIHRYDPPIE